MALVTGHIPISDDAAIHLSREMASFQLNIGGWIIELRDEKLVVRSRDTSLDILVVQAEVKV